jgi:methylthioribose-1-phosphate isomerase
VKVEGKHYRSIWLSESDAGEVCVIDQRLLPHEFKVLSLRSATQVRDAIFEMAIRGAPLIGVAAAYGMYLAARQATDEAFRDATAAAARQLIDSRPTAVNLAWAVEGQLKLIAGADSRAQAEAAALKSAARLADEDAEGSRQIGVHALPLFRDLAQKKNCEPLQILTHCNAGWLATVDWGTATSPIYQAFNQGMPVHVWVDETRPRNQGAALTAWELGKHGVPYTLITDNAGGHLMQNGRVDLVIVGTDRTTRGGDVANKIGTYLKALAAHANNIPFYVAAPSSSVDWQLLDGRDIPIEERSAAEVKYIDGFDESGQRKSVLICPDDAPVSNFGFDVTPRHLVSALITERGICQASEEGLLKLFPEQEKTVSL